MDYSHYLDQAALRAIPVSCSTTEALAEPGKAYVTEQAEWLSDQALQSLNALDGWSFYPLAIGLSTFVLASGVALVRGRRFFAPFLAWAAVVLGLLTLVPIVGFFAAILSGIWVLIISLTLFARSEAIACGTTREGRSRHIRPRKRPGWPASTSAAWLVLLRRSSTASVPSLAAKKTVR